MEQARNGDSLYDRWGNRTGMWDAVTGGNQIQSVVLQQSGGAPTNRLTSVTTSGVTANYTYDSAGNVTNDGSHTYAYDSENRIVSVDGGATASYAYDVSNQRYKKVSGGATIHYIWQGSQVIAEHNGTTGAVVTDYVYFGSRMIANVSGGSTQYLLSDRLSVRMKLDSSSTVLGRQSHLPFGEDFAESGNQEKHHFTSYERDSESGTDYAVNRQYSQNVGRFNRVDPVPGAIENPQALNRYAYSANDPINNLDPDGLDCHYEAVPIGDVEGLVTHYFWAYVCSPNAGLPRRVDPPTPVKQVRPTPMKLGKAHFSEQKFRDCAHQLWDNGNSARSKAIDDFLDNRHQGTGQNAVVFDYSMNSHQIARFLRRHGISVAGPQIAAYHNASGNQATIFFANDVFPNGVLSGNPGSTQYEYGSAVLFHEIGNWLGYGILFADPNWSSLPGGGYAQRNPNDPWSDSDSGAAMEECMYGGFVHDDGNVWNVPRGVPGTP